MNVPIDKYLGQDYRVALRVPSSPSFIDTEVPITPIIDINKGLPRPNSKQIFHKSMVLISGAPADFNITTVTSSRKVFLLGVVTRQASATVAVNVNVYDASSGSVPTINNNTVMEDTGYIMQCWQLATAGAGTMEIVMLPLPSEINYGIRINAGAVSASFFMFVYWIEEIV